MGKLARELSQLASRIDGHRAAELRQVLESDADAVAFEHGVLLGTAYPAWTPWLRTERESLTQLVRQGLRAPRDATRLRSLLQEELSDPNQPVERVLRKFAARERARVALRELLPAALGGADVDVTARELSHLADVTVDAAYRIARAATEERFGSPVTQAGLASSMVVLGMGKLGGLELNSGSDVDLIYLYDSDDLVQRDDPSQQIDAAEFYQRLARRMTALLEDVTDDGFVWRVDLRLRPEGASGPMAISVSSAERYYESFGRLWERAALLRARPIAGDLALGEELLQNLAPFIWRRRIDPAIATEMVSLVRRARVELEVHPDRDLKLGGGGIREAEFFAQALQLVWGGREPRLRVRTTAEALRRLEAHGYCTEREAREVTDAYFALRRAEHAVQNASGIQTHELPVGRDMARLSRTLGFPTETRFFEELARHRRRTTGHFLALLPEDAQSTPSHLTPLLAALDAGNEASLLAALVMLMRAADVETGHEEGLAFCSHLLELAAHPDALLGVRSREMFPGLPETLLEALLASADPPQAARYLRFFFSRVRQPAVYVRLAFSDPAALRRLVAALGASAFVGNALCNNPELGDVILFARGPLSGRAIQSAVLATLGRECGPEEVPEEFLIGALRAEKTRATLEVALADLAGTLDLVGVNHALSDLAFASLDVACRAAQGVSSPDDPAPAGLSVMAMGKLGGREISYGSDLDVLFVFDPQCAPDPSDATHHFTRVARRIIRLLSTFHGAGPGYELDTRLRPSGNQGLLVTSLEAFARYHGLAESGAAPKAAIWERMALTRARFAAGDPVLGERLQNLCQRAAYSAPVSREQVEHVRDIRERVEREGSEEREGRFDIKLGRGGLLDIEFIVQLSLLAHPPTERDDGLGETLHALSYLRAVRALPEAQLATLEDAYRFLRQLELRLRIVRADGAHVLEEEGRLLQPLARRLGLRDHPARTPSQALLEHYRTTTTEVRAILDEFFAPSA